MELKASGVKKVFQRAGGRRFSAVETLDFALPPKTLTEITGRSGSGKSTLLLMLAGLLPPSEGKVTLDGRELGRGEGHSKHAAEQQAAQNAYNELKGSARG